jgi:hypothetical protein
MVSSLLVEKDKSLGMYFYFFSPKKKFGEKNKNREDDFDSPN